jgi:uncharacterized membrane protein
VSSLHGRTLQYTVISKREKLLNFVNMMTIWTFKVCIVIKTWILTLRILIGLL